MSTTCLVSFTARSPSGAILPNAKAVFVPVGADVAAIGAWTVPRERVEVIANASGQASVALVGGSWTVTFITALGQMTAPFDCPASGTANLETLLGQSLIPAFNAIQLAVLAAGGRGLFETPAAGRAATTNGQIFLAPLSPSGVGIYRRDSASVSPQIGTYFGGEVTSSPIDTTAGRITRVGDFGIGATNGSPTLALNSATTTGIYNYVGTDPNSPFGAEGGSFIVTRHAGTFVTQLAFPGVSRLAATRTSSDSGATWTAWSRIYNQTSILGPVSQSAGVPTGALFEPISNANGRAIRYPDGTQICWHELPVTGAINTAFLGGFRNAGQTWTYPAAFVAAPVVQASPGNLNSLSVLTNAAGVSAVTVFHAAVSSQASASLLAELTAIGRWF